MAGAHASRNALAQSANKVLEWARHEEERIFIIGGAVGFPNSFFFFDAGLLEREVGC